jgi:hypothetical protein
MSENSIMDMALSFFCFFFSLFHFLKQPHVGFRGDTLHAHVTAPVSDLQVVKSTVEGEREQAIT